jgi:hypothetical protein
MPGSLSQILVLLVFIIPGFVMMRVKRVAYPAVEPSAASIVLDSLALSCLVYALASPFLYVAYLHQWYVNRPVLFGTLALAILLVLPFALGSLYVWATKTERARWLRQFVGFPHPDPTAWDYHFRKAKPYWVWLTFKSGQVLAGLFGPNSFAGSFPHRQDIYVEKLLSLDRRGKVEGLIENSAGALVRMDDLERIEFFEVEGVDI